MKRLFFISMLFSLGVACNKNEEIVTPKDSANEEKVEKIDEFQTPGDKVVTATEALTRADAILSRFQTRSTPRVVKSCEYFVAKPATRSLADTIEVAFHLINYEDNAGFAMVAADERATDIYAYSDEGELTPEILEEHPGMSIFLDRAIEYYQAEVRGFLPPPEPWPGDDPIGPLDPIRPSDVTKLPLEYYDGKLYFCKTEEVYTEREPLISSYWHQMFPYNTLSNGVQFGSYTGCGINSIGQIMSYYKHPSGYGTSIYDWDLMTQASSHTAKSVATELIALLMYDIGTFLGVKYESDGTSVTTSQSWQALWQFGYSSNAPGGFSEAEIRYELDQTRPVWIRGDKGIPNTGHAWVIDAYHGTKTTKTYYNTISPYEVCHRDVFWHNVYYRNVWGWKYLKQSYTLALDFEENNQVQTICNIKPC